LADLEIKLEIKIPLKPPDPGELLQEILTTPEDAKRFFEISNLQVGPAPNGKYRHWDIVRHLTPPADLTTEEWWLAIKLARRHLYQNLPITAVDGRNFRYAPTDIAYRMLHRIDRDAGGVLKGFEQITDPHMRETYILKSLIEEAITSSQLEGAATTSDVAADMLRRGRDPTDRSEQMVYNNYQAMRFIRQLGDQPLTPHIVLELHRIVASKTLDDPDAAGRLRTAAESIRIIDEYGQVLHNPTEASVLPGRLEAFCRFANERAEDTFIHPVIRAILLHFWLAYDHPFVDGNGRTSRAVFYWAMKTQGYWLCEFVSISSILKKAPTKYSRSFLYTETDENDVTYFILYQLRVLIRAIESLHQYLQAKAQELRQTRLMLQQSNALRTVLNHRQLALVNHALKNPRFVYTIASHRNSHNVSYQTARTDLLQLAELELVHREKSGRTFIFLAPADLHPRLQQFRDGDVIPKSISGRG